MNEATRAHVYRVLVAVAALAAGYGIVDQSAVPMWLAVAAALLGNGLATANTSRRPTEHPFQPAAQESNTGPNTRPVSPFDRPVPLPPPASTPFDPPPFDPYA